MATRIEFHKHGGPEVLQAVEFTPADPAENEIQVENKAIGINFIDTYIRSGLYPPPSLPSGLGTEAAGIVSKVGSGVKHIKAGDRVVYAQGCRSLLKRNCRRQNRRFIRINVMHRAVSA